MTDTTINTGFQFDNSYAAQLTGFYVPMAGDLAPAPSLVKLNTSLAQELGLDLNRLSHEELARIFSGGTTPEGAEPLAQVYAGHQFGNFSPQLGDGRALLLGEVIDQTGNRRDIHLKGSGSTPYSRGGDGKAALGPMLREYIISEAMHALGIPTTRSLAVVSTGEKVVRDSLLPGAVLARVASSHIRVGTFQYFAARKEPEKVKQLADYTLQRHFPELLENENPYLSLLGEVCDRQAALLAKWMHNGFIHGVMNTDNMTISGETIDYGPCAFMDIYDPSTVFSSIDRLGRYAYANQAPVAQWNLARLAETLLQLIDTDSQKAIELAMQKVRSFAVKYQELWLSGMRSKLGLSNSETDDQALADELFASMDQQAVDFTKLFRYLADSLQGDTTKVKALFDDAEKFDQWYGHWQSRLERNPMAVPERIAAMHKVNPVYIPRNHLVEDALEAAEKEFNLEPLEKLLTVLADPFSEKKEFSEYAEPAPEDLPPYQTFCGT